MSELNPSKKSLIFVEVALSWGLGLLSFASLAFAYVGHVDGPDLGWFGYALAAVFAVSAGLFYFAAGHLERTSKLSLLPHLAPMALLLLFFCIGRVAA